MTLQAPPQPTSPSRVSVHPPHPRHSRVKPSSATFIREFLRDPTGTASVVPSSPALAKRMLAGLDLSVCRSIIEFGPGTGVFTKAVLERVPDGWLKSRGGHGTFVAVEFNERLASAVRAEHPEISVVHDDAANVEAICRAHGVRPGEVDLVISGLGFAALPEPVTTNILEATARVLRPGGSFRTFTYHVSLIKKQAWHFRSEARRLFGDVQVSRGVWANLPPAFVYMCTK